LNEKGRGMTHENPAKTRIKICGITRFEDARAAVDLGVQYLGFIFAESPRRVSAAQAASMTRQLPDSVCKVGIFVDEDETSIRFVVEKTGLDMIQLHGEEPPEMCDRFDLPVIKVIRTTGEEALDRIGRYDTDFVLLEPYVPDQAGGTGKTADWGLAKRIVEAFSDRRFFLAGGLDPTNVTSAIRTVRPYAVDASSGLEVGPGVKSHHLMREFVENVRTL
jgi:phosphoribosylanthranilate isomerase